jgi:hypothetical protein
MEAMWSPESLVGFYQTTRRRRQYSEYYYFKYGFEFFGRLTFANN